MIVSHIGITFWLSVQSSCCTHLLPEVFRVSCLSDIINIIIYLNEQLHNKTVYRQIKFNWSSFAAWLPQGTHVFVFLWQMHWRILNSFCILFKKLNGYVHHENIKYHQKRLKVEFFFKKPIWEERKRLLVIYENVIKWYHQRRINWYFQARNFIIISHHTQPMRQEKYDKGF